MDNNDKSKKQAMKQLRAERKEMIKAASARMKIQKKKIEAIKEQLNNGERTIPEVAEATGLEPAEVLWFVAALKKYGEVVEGEKDGSFFRYQLAAGLSRAE